MNRCGSWARRPGLPALALALLIAGPLGAQGVPAAEAAPPETPPVSRRAQLRDPVDGQFDVSAFVDQAYGFVPIVIPITEPAVGFGAGGGLVFIDKPGAEAGKFARPNITAVGGLGTENGTRGVFALDSRQWLDGRLQTVVAGVSASVNLDYYGLGDDRALREQPLRYNLKPVGGVVQGKVQLGQSRFSAGLGYLLSTMQVGFSAPAGTPGLPSFQRDSRIAALTPSFGYDTRDNIFTPTRGLYAEASASLFSEALGGDRDFQKAAGVVIYYVPLQEKLTLGLRGDVVSSFGQVPFYLRPSVQLRGVAAMSYQGDDMAQLEAELRWQCWGRWSIVGFSGAGFAWHDSGPGNREKSVVTYGTGFRYEIARKYGLHMGVDVAFGPDNPAVYVQFGSAWMRP